MDIVIKITVGVLVVYVYLCIWYGCVTMARIISCFIELIKNREFKK